MILVLGRGRSSRVSSVMAICDSPSVTTPCSPPAQETVTSCWSYRTSVALPQPTMAGRPSSRLMMAACEVRPPRSVTMAAARFMTGTQSGSVVPVTSTEPSLNRVMSSALSMIDTRPATAPLPTLSPVSRTGPGSTTE